MSCRQAYGSATLGQAWQAFADETQAFMMGFKDSMEGRNPLLLAQ
ncbi:MAG: hypothetical protein Q9M82_05020 [Mariprofundus sp.]|nr:hypothetical protein [Mariprofundus sp.]